MEDLQHNILTLISDAVDYYIDNPERADEIAHHCIDGIMTLIEEKLDGCFTEN